MKRILVTGATGTVGSHVVSQLTQKDVAVRAGVRNPERANEQFVSDVECVAFDFHKPETWGAAFADVDAMFLIRPPSVSRVKRHLTPAVDAAARVGVDHVVYLSVLGAEKNPLLPHHRIEDALRETDVTYTFLRASFFMQNLSEVHREDIVDRDEIFVPAGDGTTSFVDARDIAAVAVAALTEPGHENRAYDVTGPEALTYDDVAEIFSEVLDREIEYTQPGPIEFATTMYRRNSPLPFVIVMLGIYTTARLGLAGRVTDDVADVLGRPPRTMRAFVKDHAEVFQQEASHADERQEVDQ
ncbi:SDR family oxidoreductase [Haloarcula sp. Atlit-120R]|uniref:SDR family oxidoreductase n=1 Tax=Haloarcula sp. Atlit-120R TaxID=2282135 RepID=UPI000EF2465E|nr:SDR family oxidoreductase [Haloarcula sp. Atlit-120R]RLM32964.1 SDR family NAD(P)-dependent oxidoreductase [Haloarcula sp. Atlit-120R]